MSTSIWKNVKVAVQSALAASVAVTAISKADPAVCTCASAAEPPNGEFVLMKTEGMSEINYRVFRVAGSADGSFSLEGEDSTSYDDFVSGTFEVITFGSSLGTVRSVNASGGEPKYEDDSDIHTLMDSEAFFGFSVLKYDLENRWDPANTALIALKDATRAGEDLAVRFTFANGQIAVFYASVGFSLAPGGSGVVTTPGAFAAKNFPTYYAS